MLFLHDLTRARRAGYDAGDARIAARLPRAGAAARVLDVFNKADAAARRRRAGGRRSRSRRKTGAGLDALRRALLELAGWQAAPEGVFIARARHVMRCAAPREHLDAARGARRQRRRRRSTCSPRSCALAHDALGEITGAFSADDLLGAIFSRFCIGK